MKMLDVVEEVGRGRRREEQNQEHERESSEVKKLEVK